MNSESEKCPVCDTPKSGWLDGNCPTCLIRLATPIPVGASELEDVTDLQRGAGGVQRLGDYELIEEIARGGMGIVYRARQMSLNRLVAVKVMLATHARHFDLDERRFRREAEVAGSLRHPNIVSVYEVGEQNGQLYFAMELIEGRSLADMVREHPLPVARAAELVKTIAEAVHFAHEHSLLHRDLKPSNVLVDEFNAPHITDFGLAKRVDGDADLTLSGQVLGTPNYMPPEQADSRLGRESVRSDVYSLGAVLYHLVTGRPPFMAETLTATLRLVSEGQVAAPRLLNPGLPRDLETICLKCLEKDARRRYASAREVAEELGRFLKDEPIFARPIGGAGKVARWCRRKPALASALGAAVVLLLVIAIGSPIAMVRISKERNRAEAARQQEAMLRQRAEGAERATQQQLYNALLEQARATVRSGELGHRVRALEAIRRAAAISNSAELRGEALSALALPDLVFEREMPVQGEFQLSPSFEKIAESPTRGEVLVRPTGSAEILATLPPSSELWCRNLEWSADERYLAVKRFQRGSAGPADVEVWDLASTQRIFFLARTPKGAMAFHRREPWVIAGLRETTLIKDLARNMVVGRVQNPGPPQWIASSPDGEHFAMTTPHGSGTLVSVWRVKEGTLVATNVSPSFVYAVQWHPDGKSLLIASGDGSVSLFDPAEGVLTELGRHKAYSARASFRPQGDYVITSGLEGEIVCWDLRTKERSFNIQLPSASMGFSQNGEKCAAVVRNGVQIFRFERPLVRDGTAEIGGRVRTVSFSRDSQWLAASGAEGLAVWNLTNESAAAMAPEGANARVGFAPNGELYSAHHGTFLRWGVAKTTNGGAALEPKPVFKAPRSPAFGFTPDALVMTSAGGTRVIPFEDVADPDSAGQPTIPGISAVSADGQWLAIHEELKPHLLVYSLPKMELSLAATNEPDENHIEAVQFSPNGDELAVVLPDRVKLWSVPQWKLTRTITNFSGFLYVPNKAEWWLRKGFREAGLFDAKTLEPLLPLPTDMLPLAMSPDGRYLAVRVDARRLQWWDMTRVRQQLRGLGLDWDRSPR